MRALPRPWRYARVAAGLALLLLCGRAWGRPFDLSGGDWEGFGEFTAVARQVLGARLTLPVRLDLSSLRPDDGLIFIHPERPLDAASLESFMRDGGRVVLLDDFGAGDGLLRHFDVSRVPLPTQPALALRHNPAFAIAERAELHPLTRGVDRVVLNHGTGLSRLDLSPVLVVRGRGEPDVFAALAGTVGTGRLAAVGDASVFINAMLRYPGNRTFAENVVRYAAGEDTDREPAKSGRVFVFSGSFEETGVYARAPGDPVADRLSFLQGELASLRRDGMSTWAAYAFSVLIGFGVVLWTGARAGRLYRPTVPRFTRAIPLMAQGGLAGRAAVIGGDRASRVLAMLELKAALEEDLSGLIGRFPVPAANVLVEEVAARRLLDAEGAHTLRRLLLRLANVETIMLSRRQAGKSWDRVVHVRDRELLQTAATVKSLLSVAHANARVQGLAP